MSNNKSQEDSHKIVIFFVEDGKFKVLKDKIHQAFINRKNQGFASNNYIIGWLSDKKFTASNYSCIYEPNGMVRYNNALNSFREKNGISSET